MKDEGVIKYHCAWIPKPALASFNFQAIENARSKMFAKKWIGFDEIHQVGYGNISERLSGQQFIISGTQTGHLPHLSPNEYVVVTDYDIQQNSLRCEGPIKASSESLTHAAIYEQAPSCQCIIHIHDNDYWSTVLKQQNIPITTANTPYGTPEMAQEIFRLFETEKLNQIRVLAMAGHEGGIIAFGDNFEEVVGLLEEYCPR